MKYEICLRAALIAAFFSSALCGCISDADPNEGGEPVAGTAVEFPTTISQTRAFDDKWEWGDEIGVYMIPSAKTPHRNWSTIELYAQNKRYIHNLSQGDDPDDEVVFTGFDADNTILWPGGEEKFDVVAYYPWTNSIDGGYLYPVELSDQSSLKKLDLMWSDNVRGRSSGAPALGFVHKLSNLIFNVTDTTGASLDGMTALLDGLPTTASFDLAAGEIANETEGGVKSFRGNVSSAGGGAGVGAGEGDGGGDGDGASGSAVVEAIVLPGLRSAGYTVTFTLKDSDQAVFTVAAPVYEAGKRYVYNIRLTPPVREGASFGVDGELKQITQWGDGEEGYYQGEIPKTKLETTSPAWRTPPEEQFPPYVVMSAFTWAPGSKSYKALGASTITKSGCEGIVSVMINMETPGDGSAIVSVKVGDHTLVIDHDGVSGTPPVESFAVPKTVPAADFIFRTADGKPRSGNLVIEITANSASPFIHGLGTNTDIPNNNP